MYVKREREAMIGNLGKMTAIDLIKPFSDAKKLVLRKLKDETALAWARLHPLAALVAQKTYAQVTGIKVRSSGRRYRRSDALDDAVYARVQNVEPCGKPMLLALEVSGSMAGSMITGSCLSAREASAAMALVTAATEPEPEIIGFSAPAHGGYGGMHGGGEPGIPRVNISPRMRLAADGELQDGVTPSTLPLAIAGLLLCRFHRELDKTGFCAVPASDSTFWFLARRGNREKNDSSKPLEMGSRQLFPGHRSLRGASGAFPATSDWNQRR